MDRTDQPQRLLGVDAARLLAILGMFAAHLFPLYQLGAEQAYFPTFTGVVASGRASVLFMVLAGVSLTLLTNSLHRKGFSNAKVYSILLRRALIIAVLGMLVGPANERIAVILVHYGLLFLLLPLALKLSRLILWLVSITWLVITPILWRPLAGAWDGQSLGHNPTLTDLLTPGLLLKDLTVTGYYPLFVWFGFGLLGMAIGRTRVAFSTTALRLTLGGMGVAVATLALGWFLALRQTSALAEALNIAEVQIPTLIATGRLPGINIDQFIDHPAYLWLPTGHSTSLVATIHAAACAVAIIGLMQLLIPRLAGLGRCLAGAGRAPLTLYVGHLLALPMLQEVLEPSTIWWILIGVTALFGLWLGLTKATGPLEYLVRVLSGADAEASDASPTGQPQLK